MNIQNESPYFINLYLKILDKIFAYKIINRSFQIGVK